MVEDGKIPKSAEEISSGTDDAKAKAHFMMGEKKNKITMAIQGPLYGGTEVILTTNRIDNVPLVCGR